MTPRRTSWLGACALLLTIVAAAAPAHARMGGGGGRGGGGFIPHSPSAPPSGFGGGGPRGPGGGSWQGGGWHGGDWHGHGWHGHGSSVFIGGGFFYDPFLFPPYFPLYTAPYPYPYWGPYGAYDVPTEPPPEEGPPSAGEEEDRTAESDDVASYGLVQLRGVPDGAAVDLDHRFWLEALDLDDRWLALPAGTHTITVRARGSEPVERDIEILPGQQNVVKIRVRASG